MGGGLGRFWIFTIPFLFFAKALPFTCSTKQERHWNNINISKYANSVKCQYFTVLSTNKCLCMALNSRLCTHKVLYLVVMSTTDHQLIDNKDSVIPFVLWILICEGRAQTISFHFIYMWFIFINHFLFAKYPSSIKLTWVFLYALEHHGTIITT